jgi:hypothetical protein
MKSVFGLLATVILVSLNSSECRAQKPLKETLVDQLKSLEVTDYLELSPSQAHSLAPFLPKVDNEPLRAQPKVVFKKSKGVSHDWIVVSIADIFTIPGCSSAAIYFLKEDGGLIRSEVFNIGYRMYFHGIKVVKYPDINDYLIEIQTAGMFSSARRNLQYLDVHYDWQPRERSHTIHQTYAFQNNRVKLVQLTNEDGLPIANFYHVRHFTFGPQCDYSLNDVEGLLCSNDLVDQLHGLIWLNGRHYTGRYWQEHQHERQKSIESYLAARKSQPIRKLLEEKQGSSHYLVSDLSKWVAKKWAKPFDPDRPDE